MIVIAASPAALASPPGVEADPALRPALEEALGAAFRATESQGAWPAGAWRVRLHGDAAGFEQATGAPPGRAGQWVGDTLHLRPWEQLRRRDLGALLRHELVHRRLVRAGLRRWEEEARCLWAEGHLKPPDAWPDAPAAALQARLDRALAGGTTREQTWAYRWLRAWLRREMLPSAPRAPRSREPGWTKDALSAEDPVTVIWPAERLLGALEVNGQRLPHEVGRSWVFRGAVRFGGEIALGPLQGTVRIQARRRGWHLIWTTSRAGWIAAATEGELGALAPFEARRALAAVLDRWLHGHARQHPGGALCPLTHCAVVRGVASRDTARAAATAPRLELDPRWAFFTGSAGGHPLSPRAVWGEGPGTPAVAAAVPGDRWGQWSRSFTPVQVAALRQAVQAGLRPGQHGVSVPGAGPWPVEALRLAAGRRFGWTAWPSNACEVTEAPDGSWNVVGWGWGHNAGLCLAAAQQRAREGASAEAILGEAFPADWRMP